MSDWISIVEQHRAAHDLGSGGIIPESHYELLAEKCGPAELAEIRERLKNLDREATDVPGWDGDAHDEIWRARQLFKAILRYHDGG